MAVLGAIEIQMLADLARLKTDMAQAKAVVGDAATSMQNAFGAVTKTLAMLGAGVSAAGFTSWIKGAIDAADETAKLAQRAGLATESVAGLTLAFQQSGAGGADVLQKSMVKLSAELVNGNKTLEALGIRSRDSRQALAEIADKFAGMPDGVAKTAAAVGIFGERLGANLIPLLNAGSAGLADMDKLAAELGLTLDKETTREAEEFNDAMDSVGQGVQGAARTIAKDLLPVLAETAKEMAESSKNGGAFAGMADGLAVALEALVVLGSDVAFVFRGIWREVSTIAKQAKALATEGIEAAAALGRSAIAEAQADRARLDSFQRRVLQAREISDITRNAADLDEPRFKRAMDEANKSAAARASLLAQQAEGYKKAAAEAKKLVDAENDRLSRRGLSDLRRYDEAEAAAEKAAQDAIKAEKDLMSARGLAALRRQDEAEADAEKLAQEYAEAMKKADAKILADWQQTVDQMAQSLSDALMTGGKNLAGYLQGLFRTLVLRPVLMPAATAFSAGVSGVANAAAGGGSGGMGGMLNIGSMLGGIGTFGNAAGAGVSATLGGTGLGSLMSAAGAQIGNGAYAAGAGLGAGAMMPYVAAAYAAIKISGGLYENGWKASGVDGALKYADLPAAIANGLTKLGVNEKWANILTGAPITARLFGRALKDTGVQGSFDSEGFSGKSYSFYKGGVFRSDKTKTGALDPALDAVFDAGALAARESIKAYVKVLGLPAEAIAGITQKIKFSTKGQSAEETKAEIERFVGKYVEALAAAYKAPLAAFQQAGESLLDTLQRLATLQTFSDTLADLGGVFERVAGLSVDAREAFIDMAGGMESLGKQALQFVQDYYNRDEIAGIKATEIKEALSAVGITQDVNSRDDFRKLVDGTDVSTEVGRQQLATLLNMASAFTQVADYLTETGATLSSAAAQSPSSGITAALFAPGGQGEQVMAINGVAMWTEAVYNAVKQLTAVVQSGSASVPGGSAGAEVNSWNAWASADGAVYDRN